MGDANPTHLQSCEVMVSKRMEMLGFEEVRETEKYRQEHIDVEMAEARSQPSKKYTVVQGLVYTFSKPCFGLVLRTIDL